MEAQAQVALQKAHDLASSLAWVWFQFSRSVRAFHCQCQFLMLTQVEELLKGAKGQATRVQVQNQAAGNQHGVIIPGILLQPVRCSLIWTLRRPQSSSLCSSSGSKPRLPKVPTETWEDGAQALRHRNWPIPHSVACFFFLAGGWNLNVSSVTPT